MPGKKKKVKAPPPKKSKKVKKVKKEKDADQLEFPELRGDCCGECGGKDTTDE